MLKLNDNITAGSDHVSLLLLWILWLDFKFINTVPLNTVVIRGVGSSWTLVRQIKHWSGKIAKEVQISILK